MHCSDYPKRGILAWSLKNVMMTCITDWTQVVEIWSWIEQHIYAPSSPSPSSSPLPSPSPSSLLWQTRLNSSSMSDSLHSLRQDVLAWSCLSILWCFRSNSYVAALTYERKRRWPPCLIVCIGYSAESHGQTYQILSLANGTEGFHGTDKTLDLAPYVLNCHVFQ